MDELRKILAEVGLTDEEIDEFITESAFSDVGDLLLVQTTDQLKEFGVTHFKPRALLMQRIEAMRQANMEKEAPEPPEQNVGDLSLLLEVPEDDVWLDAIIIEGKLQFSNDTYAAGVKAIIAANAGVFKSVEKLRQKVHDYCVENALAAPLFYYDLKTIIEQRKSSVFAILGEKKQGIPIHATAEEMAALIDLIQRDFVPHILLVADTLEKWYSDMINQKTSEWIMNLGMSQNLVDEDYVDPSPIYDAIKELRLSVNRTFACDGIQKALAIYTEYANFRTILDNEDLPTYTGLVDRDAVLSALGFDATSVSIARSETFATQFVLSILDIDGLIKVNGELRILLSLHKLLRQVNWSALTNNPDDKGRYSRANVNQGNLLGNFGYASAGVSSIGMISAQLAQQNAGGQPMIAGKREDTLQRIDGTPVQQ